MAGTEKRASAGEPTYALARERGAGRAFVLRERARDVLLELTSCYPSLRCVKPLSGEPVRCEDLRDLGTRARTEGWPLVVDATICGVDGCVPERLGAHASVVGLGENLCLLALSRDVERALPGAVDLALRFRQADVAAADVMACVEASRAAWHASSDEAQVVAAYLRCHPRVCGLRYPGIKQDSSFAIANRTLQGGFGPYVDYRLVGEGAWRRLRCDGRDPRETVLSLEQALRDA